VNQFDQKVLTLKRIRMELDGWEKHQPEYPWCFCWPTIYMSRVINISVGDFISAEFEVICLSCDEKWDEMKESRI